MPSRRGRFFFASIFASLIAATWFGCAKAGETPCQFNSDCSIGYCGPDGTCQMNCVDSTRDCPSGFICDQNAQCVPRDQNTGGSGGSSSHAGGSNAGGSNGGSAPNGGAGPGAGAGSSSTGAGAGSSTSSSSGSGGAGTKQELDLCTADNQCASPWICRAMTPNGTKRCTKNNCNASSNCPAGLLCELIGAEKYCAATDTGRSCSAATQCNFACFTPGPGYCTNTCVTGSDCPNGYGCEPVGAQSTRVCVKAEAACDVDTSACIGGACDTGLLVNSCTLACDIASDCPQRAKAFTNAWTCAEGICKRPVDVVGPLATGSTPTEWACDGGQVVNICNDTLHIDFDKFTIPNPPALNCASPPPTTVDGVAGDACVDSCRYQGYCPFGSACVGLGSLPGGRAGLCLPTGGGEVGTACAHDRDCVFGYCLASGSCSRDCTADGICPSGSTCTAGGGPDVEGSPFKRCQ